MLKRFLKRTLLLGSQAAVSPLFTSELVARRLLGRDVLFTLYAQLLALVPGTLGSYLRVAYYHWTLKRCPLDGCISFLSLFTKSQAEVGHRVYVGSGCSIGWASIG